MMFEAAEIRAILGAVSPQLRAMISCSASTAALVTPTWETYCGPLWTL